VCKIAIDRARELHGRYPGLPFPLDIENLVRLEGCELIEWPLLPPVREVKRGRWIAIATGLELKEYRYLAAHALAHHLLHCGNQLAFHDLQKITHEKQEREADICAAHILMPDYEIARLIRLPTWELAEYFGVPEELVRRRLSNFAAKDETLKWKLISLGDS
jgi:hypothetical protein